MLKKYYLPLAALSVLGITSIVTAAARSPAGDGQTQSRQDRRTDGQPRRDGRYDPNQCAPYQSTEVRCVQECPPPEPPAPCYPDECVCCPICLGPENYAANPPVCPRTCNGDWDFTVAGFYWNAHQDGMEFVIENEVRNPNVSDSIVFFDDLSIGAVNNLVDADYENPHFKWDFGFKLGFAYCSPCDGWDIGVLWTWFRGRASKDVDADSESNTTLLPLWSAFTPAQGNVLYATEAEDHWHMKLNLVDVELGRQFWTSKYLSIRPFIGVRFASIDQHNSIDYRGGSWGARDLIPPFQDAFNGAVKLKNKFEGVGGRAGLGSVWNFGCGWALYGDLAASIVYGRFKVSHDEVIRHATGFHTTLPVLDTNDSFHAARAILDLDLGIQWSTMFCKCRYGFTAMLGWEGHMFFDQNQMWRVNRVAAGPSSPGAQFAIPNNSGQNVFHERRGDLDTQGWTLTFRFEF